MSCCGKKREAWVNQSNNANKTVDEYALSKIKSDVSFEYTGETGLTVIGSVTRNRYRFSGKGEKQMIDYRDASGMMAVPALTRIRS